MAEYDSEILYRSINIDSHIQTHSRLSPKSSDGKTIFILIPIGSHSYACFSPVRAKVPGKELVHSLGITSCVIVHVDVG